MQASSIDFVSNVLPASSQSSYAIVTESTPSDSVAWRKNSMDTSPTTSCGLETVLSSSLSSKTSLIRRLTNRFKFLSGKKSNDYQLSTSNSQYDQNNNQSLDLSISNPLAISKSNVSNPMSLTCLSSKRKSSRRPLITTTQHIPFIYGLKNGGNTW